MEIGIKRGDTLRFPVRLNYAGVYQDLTGDTMIVTVKNDPDDPDEAAIHQQSYSPTGDTGWVVIDPSATSEWLPNGLHSVTYYADVQLEHVAFPEGTYSALYTIQVGYDITRAPYPPMPA